jgi:ABC-type transporter Mla subunit MlaD
VTFLVQNAVLSSVKLQAAETRAARLHLLFRQNIALLTRMATDSGSTSLLGEAAQNIAAAGPPPVPPDHISKLAQTLSSDDNTECIGLLRQEVCLNTVLRRQTERLSAQSRRLNEAVQELRSRLAETGPDRTRRVCERLECGVDDMEARLAQLIDENHRLRAAAGDPDQQAAELAIFRDAAVRSRAVRMELMHEIGVMVRAKSEFDALHFGARWALKIVKKFKEVCRILGAEEDDVVDRVNEIVRRAEGRSQAIIDLAELGGRFGDADKAIEELTRRVDGVARQP